MYNDIWKWWNTILETEYSGLVNEIPEFSHNVSYLFDMLCSQEGEEMWARTFGYGPNIPGMDF